jgi:hypothetical protein
MRRLHHLTADKREIKDFPKLPSATSFIRKPLWAMLLATMQPSTDRHKTDSKTKSAA